MIMIDFICQACLPQSSATHGSMLMACYPARRFYIDGNRSVYGANLLMDSCTYDHPTCFHWSIVLVN